MKVIDLLNKIANKEEIPLIKYNGRILHYDYLNEWFEDKKDNGFCKMEVYYEDLNDEVEIIEDKKIEKIKPLLISDIVELLGNKTKNYQDEALRKLYEHIRNQDKIINELIDKINEEE